MTRNHSKNCREGRPFSRLLRLAAFSVAAAVCMALLPFGILPGSGAQPAAVYAEEPTDYHLTVGGVPVTSDNAASITGEGITGKASYDPETSTLTLENFSYTGPGKEDWGWGDVYTNYGILLGDGYFTVNLVGENSVSMSGVPQKHISEAMYSYKSLAFEGSGSLRLDPGTTYDARNYALYCESDVSLRSGTPFVTAEGGQSICESSGSSTGLYAHGVVSVYAGGLYARGGDVSGTGEYGGGDSYGIYSMDSVAVYGGQLCAIGGDVYCRTSGDSYGIRAGYPGMVSISDGSLIAAGGSVSTSSEKSDHWISSFGISTNLEVTGGMAVVQSGNLSRPTGLFSMQSSVILGRLIADFTGYSSFDQGALSDGAVILRAGLLNGGYVLGDSTSAERDLKFQELQLTCAKVAAMTGRDSENGDSFRYEVNMLGDSDLQPNLSMTGLVVVPEDYEYGLLLEDRDSFYISFEPSDKTISGSCDLGGHAALIADMGEYDGAAPSFKFGDFSLKDGELSVSTGLFAGSQSGPAIDASGSEFKVSGKSRFFAASSPAPGSGAGIACEKLDLTELDGTGAAFCYGGEAAVDSTWELGISGRPAFFAQPSVLSVPWTEYEEQVEPDPVFPGDMDLDEGISAKDLTALARMIAGIEIPEDPQVLANADVNRDGIVDAKDLTRLARIVAGIEEYVSYS